MSGRKAERLAQRAVNRIGQVTEAATAPRREDLAMLPPHGFRAGWCGCGHSGRRGGRTLSVRWLMSRDERSSVRAMADETICRCSTSGGGSGREVTRHTGCCRLIARLTLSFGPIPAFSGLGAFGSDTSPLADTSTCSVQM